MRLRTRIAVVAAGAVAVAVVIVSLGAFFITGRELRSEIDAALTERMTLIQLAADDIRPFVRGPRTGIVVPGIRQGPQFDTVYYQLVLADGQVVVPDGQELALPIVTMADSGAATVLADASVDGVHVRMISGPVGGIGVLQIARPLTEVDRTLSGVAAALFVIGVVGTALAGVIGLVVARSSLKPIDDLTEAAEHVAETQSLGERIDVDRDDEVGRLAGSFNTMLGALEESRLQQRRLVRDAGHELRTPLTALRMNVELLARGDLPPDARDQLIEAATEEVEALSLLVGEVVDLATDRYADEPIDDVDLLALVEDAVARASRRAGRPINVSGNGAIVRGRSTSLERAVDNLLDNANKWSPEGAPITVTVAGGTVSVSDQGPGIAPMDRDRVFDRFYRSDSARAMPGSGLGLSIVRQIVADHGGSVFVGEAAEGGAIVGFAIPIDAPQTS